METALLKYSLTEVIKKLRELLIKQGFLIENFDEKNKVVVAYHDGSWYRSPKHILFELSSMEQLITRIDITASIESRKKTGKQKKWSKKK